MFKVMGGFIFLILSLTSTLPSDEIYSTIGIMFSVALIFAGMDDIFFRKK